MDELVSIVLHLDDVRGRLDLLGSPFCALRRDTGYEKPTLFNPIGKAQTPSNVTRLSRSLRRVCRDGTLQIIAYQNGVGTGSTMADAITGGAFGRGIAEVS